MIRCRICGVDRDRCDCNVDYIAWEYDKYQKKMKPNWTKIFSVGAIIIALLAFVLAFTSCNTKKRAFKHIQKAERLQPNELAKWCAKRYNPIDSIYERIIYKPGEVIRDTTIETEIEIVRDTDL